MDLVSMNLYALSGVWCVSPESSAAWLWAGCSSPSDGGHQPVPFQVVVSFQCFREVPDLR